MRFLAESGANLQAKDQNGVTALDIAMGKSGQTGRSSNSPEAHPETAELLQKLLVVL